MPVYSQAFAGNEHIFKQFNRDSVVISVYNVVQIVSMQRGCFVLRGCLAVVTEERKPSMIMEACMLTSVKRPPTLSSSVYLVVNLICRCVLLLLARPLTDVEFRHVASLLHSLSHYSLTLCFPRCG